MDRYSKNASPTVKLFVTSRVQAGIQRALDTVPKIEIQASNVDADIKAYVESELESRIASGVLELRDPTLIETISASLAALLPTLTSLIEQSIYTPLSVKVFYTRASTGKSSLDPKSSFHPGLTLTPGRPPLSKMLDNTVSRTIGLRSNDEKITGMVVAVCGPESLVDDVACAVNNVEAANRDQVGGIEIHEE